MHMRDQSLCVLFRIYIGACYQHISLELIMHYTHATIYVCMYKYSCGTVGILIHLYMIIIMYYP